MSFTWQQVFVVAIVGTLCAFGIERCNNASIEMARIKANTSRDINFGVGRNRN